MLNRLLSSAGMGRTGFVGGDVRNLLNVIRLGANP